MKKFILAVESSCDETAAALVNERGQILASRLVSQIETHNKFGGVVPEVASRAHFQQIDALVKGLLADSKIKVTDIDSVAATMGPGLIGPLLVGVSYARGLAVGWDKPFHGVHHLRGHLASVFLERDSSMSMKDQLKELSPSMVLLASGGHTQVLILDENFRARSVADTADDAAGECFDKSAKLMGLPYPGGPAIEALAMQSSGGKRAQDFARSLPRPKSEKGFSFSGLKTSIRLKLEQDKTLSRDPDFCWAIQETIAEIFAQALKKVFSQENREGYQPRSLILCGGVSANRRLRQLFETFAESRRMKLCLPPLKYCTDNAAMIAAAAWLQNSDQDLKEVQARIPMDEI